MEEDTMKGLFSKVRKVFESEDNIDEEFSESPGEEYVEIDTADISESKARIIVRPYIIKEFQDVKPALDALREGYTIALINIKPLKDKDIVELKRAINKLKKTCDAIDGDIAGFGGDWIVVTPSFAQVHREHTERVEDKEEKSL